MTRGRTADRVTRGLSALKSKDLWLHAAVFLALTVWSWRKWPDPLIDFGRELYVPWQLTAGKVLYRDIASLFGPVSPYVNALWFTLFGVSLTTLIICNLAILAAMLFGLHHLVASACDRFTATAATMVTMLLFGFSQYVAVGNYNFVSPYAHEATHGLTLAIAVIVCLSFGMREDRRWPFALGGVAFGLLLLTKVETSLAMIAAVGVGLIGCAMLGQKARRTVRAGLALLTGFAALPPILFLLYFSSYMPIATAMRAIASPWTIALKSDVARNDFYVRGMGFDDPAHNALTMFAMFVGSLTVAALFAGVDRFWPGTSSPSGWLTVGRRGARFSLLLLSLLFVPWFDLPRSLPLISLSAWVALVWQFVTERHNREAARRRLPLLMWASFAIVMLAKMVLNARIYHYGFYLALPATVLAVITLVWVIPELLKAGGGRGVTFRAAAGLVLASGVAAHVGTSHALYQVKTLSVGFAGDHFLAFDSAEQWHGAAVRDVVSRIERSLPKDATIVVLPEGVMVNYLTRRGNPTPFINFMPPEIRAFGEHSMQHALEASPPDYVLLVDRDVSEYGVPPFGTDPRYGRGIMDWVTSHYEPVHGDASGPAKDSTRGIELLERRPPDEGPRTGNPERQWRP